LLKLIEELKVIHFVNIEIIEEKDKKILDLLNINKKLEGERQNWKEKI
jgi:hypothetical protein